MGDDVMSSFVYPNTVSCVGMVEGNSSNIGFIFSVMKYENKGVT